MLMVGNKNNPLFCEDGIEKSVPRNHRLSALGRPRDAKWRSLGPDFLSHPHI